MYDELQKQGHRRKGLHFAAESRGFLQLGSSLLPGRSATKQPLCSLNGLPLYRLIEKPPLMRHKLELQPSSALQLSLGLQLC
ncbi:Serine/Threonine-Protein Kinase Lmtk1 [Manis pentadactyla]|nr:Serine/Threonine-Protein Kinase Lmtk1 [Manis pentadactyla]